MLSRIIPVAVLYVSYVLGSVQGMLVHGKEVDTTIAIAIVTVLAALYAWRLGATRSAEPVTAPKQNEPDIAARIIRCHQPGKVR